MVLKPLDPAPKVPLSPGWDLAATEAGRSGKGLQASVHLLNGESQACQTILLGDVTAQQALVTAFADAAGLDALTIARALPKLTAAIEGVLRQIAPQDERPHLSQATSLVTLVTDAGVELFHTPEGDAYASILVESHTETWPLKVKGFRHWLARLFYQAEDKSPSAQALQDALGVLAGKALFDGSELPVYTRLAEHQGAIYLDLVDKHWRAVEVTAHGWRVVTETPVKFRRARGMLPLPVPVRGGSLADLRPFVNLARDEDWRLVVSWLLAAFRPTGPYPVLIVHGEQGSAKSTLVRVLRALVDPNKAALRTTPRDERDLVIAATNGWVIAFDNLGHLSKPLSDALCRLATGTGFATRELYTDAEEVIFEAQRPIVMNAIEELATEGDMLSRAMVLYLPPIPEERRKDEKTYWSTFEAAQPQLLGVLLDIVSGALQQLPRVTLDRLPRMADFAVWACAAADACGWTVQDFLETYQGVREAAYDLTLEASPAAPVVRDLVEKCHQWEGTASELLTALEALVGNSEPAAQGKWKVGSEVTKHKAWPKNGRTLSNALRRLAPTLRAVGVEVTFDREPGGKRQRIIRLAQGTSQAPQERQQRGTDTEQTSKPDERDQEFF